MIVAASGPLHYLILLDYTELLRRFMTSFYVDDALVNAIFQRWLRP